MSVEKAKAKLDEASEIAFEKRKAYLLARVKASKLEKKYMEAEDNLPPKESKKLCADWYTAERQADIAKWEAEQTDKAEEKAEKKYDAARKKAEKKAKG